MSSRPLREPIVLYLDRNVGSRIVAGALREAGIPCEIHDDHLPPAAADEDWIRLCARRGWLGVTKDKNIRYRAAEIGAIVAAKAAVLVLRAKNATGAAHAEILVTAYEPIASFARSTPRPFVAGINRDGKFTRYPLS